MSARRKKEWFDDEAFWRDLYPFLFPKQRFTQTPDEMEKLLRLTAPSGKSVLDLCCGPGRCSIALAQAGFEVTGVDRTNYLLRKARARARAAKVTIEWVQMDMRDFVRAEAFDLVLSMFTSFGYSRVRNEWILIRKGRARRFRFRLTIYSGQELTDRMQQVGFTEVKLYGNLEGEAYGPEARRLIAVGRKKVGR